MMKTCLSAFARRGWVAAGILVLGVGIVSFTRGAERNGDEEAHTEKVTGTPHFYQGDPRGQFAGDGSNYCCPTAVSDSLVYLSEHGFPRLLPGGNEDREEAQIALINKLASPESMKTNPSTGTDAGEACLGIRRYVEGAGYVCKTLEYRGWRPMPKSAASYAGGTAASLEWIKEATANPHGAAWVNIGWYVRGSASGEWKRVGGHWLAVVGYGVDGEGNEDPGILLVDNPAKRPARSERRRNGDSAGEPTDEELASDVMTTQEIRQGRLVGNYAGLPRSAAGMYVVSGDGVSKSTKLDAILDGAVVLVVGERRR